LKIIDHTLVVGEAIAIEGPTGTGFAAPDLMYPVIKFIDKDTIQVEGTLTGVYAGGFTVARVSNIQINSKQWNPYDKEGRNFYLARIDFLVDRTTDGEITVDYAPSTVDISMLSASNGSIMGNGVLETFAYDPRFYPLEQFQDRLWHPIYFQTTGECVEIFMKLSEDQLLDSNIAWADLQIHAFLLHTTRSSSRLQ
jgi:hypothetical protein